MTSRGVLAHRGRGRGSAGAAGLAVKKKGHHAVQSR